MTVLLIAVLVMLILFLVWFTEKSLQWERWLYRAANEAPLRSRFLMLITVAGCLGFWWITSGR